MPGAGRVEKVTGGNYLRGRGFYFGVMKAVELDRGAGCTTL